MDRVQSDLVQVGWCDLLVLSVGQVDFRCGNNHVIFNRLLVPGRLCRGACAAPPRPNPLGQPNAVEKVLVVEVYSQTGQAVTLYANQLTYTHLGPRMHASSTDNMRMTVQDMVNHAPHAARTEAVDKFLQGCLLHDIHFPDLGSLQEQSLWLLQARRQGWLGTGIVRPATRFDALEL